MSSLRDRHSKAMAAEFPNNIGIVQKRVVEFTLADGTTVKRAVSERCIIFPEREAHTPKILSQSSD
jgi:hypothetical protein